MFPTHRVFSLAIVVLAVFFPLVGLSLVILWLAGLILQRFHRPPPAET